MDGGVQFINDVIHELPININTYIEKMGFYVMTLRSTNIILGYPQIITFGNC